MLGNDATTLSALVESVAAGAVADPAETATLSIPTQDLIDLCRKLQSQPMIEEAKGILMGYYGIGADTAFQVLRRWSQDGNVKLRTAARALVEGVALHPCSDVPPHCLVQRVITTPWHSDTGSEIDVVTGI